MNAIELIAALKGADEETAMELVERLQCGEIDCSVLPTGKDSAVQQAQIWAQEARTQKGIVEEIGKLVGCANDWETVSAVKAALSGAQQGEAACVRCGGAGSIEAHDGNGPDCHLVDADCPDCGGTGAPQPAQVPEGWRLVPVEPTTEMLGEGAIALFAQSREPLSSAYRSMLAAAPRCPMLTAAPSGDAKPFTETSRPIDDAMVGLPNGSFKAFHASLCRRFGFPHDDQYWWRDLVSLEEHIAAGFGDAKREAEELRKDAERYQWLRNRIFAADFDYGGLDAPCLIIAFPKGSIFTSDADATIDAARLRQSSDGDDSEGVE